MEGHTCLLGCLKCSLIRSEDLIRGFVAPNTGDRLCGVTVCTWAVTDSFSFMEILIFSDSIVQRSLANHSYTSYRYLLEVVPGCLHAAAQLRNWMSYQAGFHIKWWIPSYDSCSFDDKPSRWVHCGPIVCFRWWYIVVESLWRQI